MAVVPAVSTNPTSRLARISRLLADLKVTEEYLRQYPGLADKVMAVIEQPDAAGKGS